MLARDYGDYEYLKLKLPDHERGIRLRLINGVPHPSFSTIDSFTSDKSSIEAWRQRIGVEKADAIVELSSRRGDFLHDWMELSCIHKVYTLEELQELLPQKFSEYENQQAVRGAQQMFNKMMKGGVQGYVDEVIMSEVMMYTSLNNKSGDGIYGFTMKFDMLAKDKHGEVVLIDWKNSRKPKRDEYVENYKMQIAAYWHGIEKELGYKIDTAKIIVVNEQNWKIQVYQLRRMQMEFWLDKFYTKLKMFFEEVLPAAIKYNRSLPKEERLPIERKAFIP